MGRYQIGILAVADFFAGDVRQCMAEGKDIFSEHGEVFEGIKDGNRYNVQKYRNGLDKRH